MKLKVIFFLIISSLAFTQNSNAMNPNFNNSGINNGNTYASYNIQDKKLGELIQRMYLISQDSRLSETDKKKLYKEIDDVLQNYEESVYGNSCKNICVGMAIAVAGLGAITLFFK